MNEGGLPGENKMEGRSVLKLRKRIVPFEEGNPAEEPLFINYAQVARAGGSAYIDVGVIPLDEILAEPPDEATFLVLTRLVMSTETIAALGDQINKLLSGHGETEVGSGPK